MTDWAALPGDPFPDRAGIRAFRDLCDEGQRLERSGHLDQARAEYEAALRCLEPGLGGATASTILRWIARTWQAEARYDEALDALEAAYASARQEGDERALGHAQNLHAIIWWRQGGLDEARGLYLAARERAQRHGDSLLAAMTAQNLGVIASIRGEQDEALAYYDSALREYRHLEMHRDECITLNNRGLLQTRLGRWSEAEASYQEALDLSRRFSYEDIRTQLKVNLASLTVARGDYDRAQREVMEALGRARARDDASAVAEALKLAGIVARARKNFEAAEVHFRDAARIAEGRQNILLLAELHRESALLYRAAGRNRELLQSLNAAHRLFSQLKARHDLADIERTTRDLEGEFIDVARRWGESTESKDRYTQGHCERVADVACALARRTGLDETTLFWFRIGTLLHDVGKLVIPEEVLNKPGRLTADEWELVKQHPAAGMELLSGIEFPWDVTPIVRSHHEYWDGSGYPDGLVGEDIPLVARIVCLADVYDALTTERSYKRALTHDQAMTLMRKDIGRQFDPELFRLFEEVMSDQAPAEAPLEDPAPPAPSPEAVTRDELTGLALRRPFVEQAAARLAEAGESQAYTLAVIDVDSFKSVNDTFGHLQGDDVLRAVARVLAEGIREFDLAGRYAGDEFVLLLRADIREATQVAERLRETVARMRIPLRDAEEGEVGVSLSIGLATHAVNGSAFEDLFAAADRALYDAKRRGRNFVCVAGGGEGGTGKPRLDLERFVGRTEEVSKLVTHFEAAVRGAPRVVALVGEAGVGKTTLVRRIATDVRLRTGIMVFGRSQEPDVRPPYGPWVDVIAGLHGMGVVPARRWVELERLIPKLRSAPTDTAPQTPGSKYALLDEIVEFLRLAASQRPVVLVLDDMQWGDTASWDAVEHVVTQLERERILICLTIRREDADRIEKSRQRLSRHEHYHELHVGRLLPSEVRSWVMGALRQNAVEDDLPDALYRFTEGNPLFVKQVLQSLFDDGLIWHNGVSWEWKDIDALTLPTAVDDLLGRRLSRLAPSSARTLAVAAVFGRTFDFDDVLHAAEVSDEELLDTVDEAVAAGVIEAVGLADPNQYVFVHGLLADALKRSLNPRRLRVIQRRVAATLVERRPHAHTEIAALFDQAGDATLAYRHALIAGDRAAEVYALDDAASSLRIAVRRAVSDAERFEARRRLLRVVQLAGRYAEAETLADELAADSGSQSPELRIAASRARIEIRALRGEPAAATLAALESLLAEAACEQCRHERVLILTLISDLHARQGAWMDAQRLAREAREAATALNDAELQGDATIRLGTALLDRSPEQALQHFNDARHTYAAINHRFGETRCLVNAGISYQRLGMAAEAELAYREALAMAEAANVIDLAGLASLNLGVLLTRGGRYDAADEQYQRAMRAFKKVKNEPRRAATLYNLAHLAYEQGDAAKARNMAQAAVDLATELGMVQLRIGAVARVGLAELALGAKDEVERIATLLDEAVPAQQWFAGRECVEAFRARRALQQGDLRRAQDVFTRAAEAVGGDPYDLAWLVAEAAALFRASGDAGLARIARQARRDADRLGFSPLAKRLALVVSTDAPVGA